MSSPKTGDKRELQPAEPVLAADKKARTEHVGASILQESAPGPSAVIFSEEATTSHGFSKSISKKAAKAAKRHKKKLLDIEPCSRDDVYWQEVKALLGLDVVEASLEEGTDLNAPFVFREEVDLEISELSSNGEGLALAPPSRRPWVVVIPFTLPGETVRARVYRSARLHSFADLVNVIKPNALMRDMSAIKCKYFGTCAGCQYQMLSYDMQLELKRNVVVKAYNTYSGLLSPFVPLILPTAPSPLQYGYRTKITPHFDAPSRAIKRKKPLVPEADEMSVQPTQPPLHIGFNQMGKKEVMDIEECPIATPILNETLAPLRENIRRTAQTYKKGVSLLLRDSLEIPPNGHQDPRVSSNSRSDTSAVELAKSFERHVCVTDHNATVRERVGDMLFEYPGGSFFQNNNSVLMPLITYVKDAIFPGTQNGTWTEPTLRQDSPTHLVDAYCGSGFFSIMLSPYFDTVTGIELSSDSIRAATANAALNGLPAGKCTFRAGDAAAIFDAVRDFPPARTTVIIDPPRKGCDERFIDQLLCFRATMVVYVSCNVHTQARDVGLILRRSEADGKGAYHLESIRGFDLFPQTAHVESVAVMRL